MTNKQVIEKFLNREMGATPKRQILNGVFYYDGRTLTSNGNELINYSTKMAYFDKCNLLHINTGKYSVTTSKIQGQIKYLASINHIDFVEYKGI